MYLSQFIFLPFLARFRASLHSMFQCDRINIDFMRLFLSDENIFLQEARKKNIFFIMIRSWHNKLCLLIFMNNNNQ